MKTIKLPYSTTAENFSLIQKVQKQSTSMIKLAYNRFKDGLTEKDIRLLSKSYNNIELLDSWLIQCAIRKAKTIYTKDSTKNQATIFGGKKLFKARCSNKISRQDYKQLVLLPICSQGEKLQGANRKFKFNLSSNQIEFMLSRNQRILLTLPRLKQNYLREFQILQKLIDAKQITISIELTTQYLYLTYDETLLKSIKTVNLDKSIVAALDLNPNFIGFSISQFKHDKQISIHEKVFNISAYTVNKHLASNSTQQKYLVNKYKHELIEICKHIVLTARYYGSSKLCIENLSNMFNMGIRPLNRLCKNKWNKQLIIQCITKYCKIYEIECILVNPAYSSLIGNIEYDKPDMIAASLEIARRGYYQYVKGKFYPELNMDEKVRNRWKEASSWTCLTWKDLFNCLKTAGVKYRNSLNDYKFKVFRFNSIKSNITCYSFI